MFHRRPGFLKPFIYEVSRIECNWKKNQLAGVCPIAQNSRMVNNACVLAFNVNPELKTVGRTAHPWISISYVAVCNVIEDFLRRGCRGGSNQVQTKAAV